MDQGVEQPVREDCCRNENGCAHLCPVQTRIGQERCKACYGRPANACKQAVRIGEDELWLVGGAEVNGNSDGLPTEQDKQPEREVKKEGSKDKNAEVDAPLGSRKSHRCAYMTCKHGNCRGLPWANV